MKYIITLNERVYEVEVEHGSATVTSEYDASLVQTTKPVSAPKSAAAAKQAPVSAPVSKAVPPTTASASVPESSGGEEVISSPMPGNIFDVRVTQGASVKRGDVLLILEAMKMENEIISPRDGTVKQLLTSKGAAVDTGAPLIVLS